MLHVAPPPVPVGLLPIAPARIVRSAALRDPGASHPCATMYVSGHGGAIRRLLGTAHRHVIAMLRDPQVPYGQPTEGVVEGPAVMRCATDPDVGFYQSQPFRIVLQVNGGLDSYSADLLYVDLDGVVWVREVKRTAADLKDPAYVAKMEAVRRLLARLGWRFKPWFRSEIEGTADRQVNVGRIWFDRNANIDGVMPRFDEFAANSTSTTFGALRDRT